MTGRHRLGEPPDSLPANRLVCNTLDMGGTDPSVLRECLEPTQHGICHTQIWVSEAQLPAVTSGELRPVCWPCHRQTGRHLAMHHLTVDELILRDQLAQGWCVLGETNARSGQPESPGVSSTPSSPVADEGPPP